MMKYRCGQYAAHSAHAHGNDCDFGPLADSLRRAVILQTIAGSAGPYAAKDANGNYGGGSGLILQAGPACRGAEDHRDPSPHGVQLPHVAQIAEVGQPQWTVPGNLP